jgi:hypothetical protein
VVFSPCFLSRYQPHFVCQDAIQPVVVHGHEPSQA